MTKANSIRKPRRMTLPVMLAGLLTTGVSLMSGCASKTHNTFADDTAFIGNHAKLCILKDGDARVATSPQLMGRVMTATFAGENGPSLGFISRENIAKGDTDPVFNNYGGADRFWLGPEGGQFSIFFEKGAKQENANWNVPEGIDSGGMDVVSLTDNQVSMRRDIHLINYSGTKIDLLAERTIRLVSRNQAAAQLDVDLGSAKFVGYESINKITNRGKRALDRTSGTVSLWILSMYVTTPHTVVIAPYNKAGKGNIVNDEYFGKVPADRLVVLEEAGAVLFKTDGKLRSKIGLAPGRAKNILGSIDFDNNVLTLCTFSLPSDTTQYVNSMWVEKQENPFAGDVCNSYNDDGKMGGFYEMETSSPAAFLEPNQSYTHTHRMLHIQAEMGTLEAIARKTLGVCLADVRKAMF